MKMKNPLIKLLKKFCLKEAMKENHFSILLELLSDRKLKFTRVTSKN